MKRLISDITFSHPQSFTEVWGQIVQTYESFAHTGFRLEHERQENIRARIQSDTCTLCGGAFKAVHEAGYKSLDVGVSERIVECQACGNWMGVASTTVSGKEWLIPFLRDFQPQRHIPALTTLLSEAKKNPNILFSQSPKHFELFVGSVLKEFFNCDVYHVGKSRDGGIDLIAVAADEPIMIQVKRRLSPKSIEGLDVVKLLFASMFAQRAKKGMVISTAQRFSADAKKWVHLPLLKDQKYEIDLVAFDRLLQMTRSVHEESAPSWDLCIPYWRSVPPALHSWVKAFGLDAIKVRSKDATIPLKEDRSFKDDESFVRCGDGYVLTLSKEETKRFIYFKDSNRSECWDVSRCISPGSKEITTNLVTKTSLDFSTEHTKTLSGAEFHEVLYRMPRLALEKLTQTWALTAGEAAVTWED